MAVSADNPLACCRTFLFIPGADASALQAAVRTGADVLVQELEDFTPPSQRPQAREIALQVMTQWRKCGHRSAVRINPFETCGQEDLEAVMAARPEIVMMSKVESRAQVEELHRRIGVLESRYRIEPGSTLIVPNIETALGVVHAVEIAKASPRVQAMLIATEDMVSDLGAGRSRAGTELFYARSRFLLECAAAGVLAIDSPYTFADDAGAEADMQFAQSIGYQAKGVVNAAHVAVANRYLTPTSVAVALAQRHIAAFEQVSREGSARAEVDGLVVEVPSYYQAKRLLDRHVQLNSMQALRSH